MQFSLGTYLYGTKLIRTRTEPLRNKKVFIKIFNLKGCYIYLIIIFKSFSTFSTNPTVWLIARSTLFKNYDWKDAISKTTDFKFIDSRSEYLFRTYSIATSLVTSLTLILLGPAVVNTEWFRNHSSFNHRLLPLLMNTELFGNH